MNFNKKLFYVLLFWMAIFVAVFLRYLYLPHYEAKFLKIGAKSEEIVIKKPSSAKPSSTSASDSIPKIVHFAIGFDSAGENSPIEFELYQYLAIKAAKLVIQPDALYLHYFYKPTGPWFDKALKYVDNLEKVNELPTEVFHIKLNQFQHRTDVFRLKALQKYGGIFLDLDVIMLKKIDDLLEHEFVISRQGELATNYRHGMTMSFLMAKSSSIFLTNWLESYRNFDAAAGAHHCCQVPLILSYQFPMHAHILEHRAVAWPVWSDSGVKEAFYERTCDYGTNYATHLWATQAGNVYLRNLTLQKIWQIDTSLFCKLRELTRGEDGAGIWNLDAIKNCEIITIQNAPSRRNGLIGQWDFQNLTSKTLPKIPDSSGNRMHGLLNPLNSYEFINEETVNNTNFMAFHGGDHVYLPMLPESSIRHFTLTFRVRLLVINENVRFRKFRKAVILSIEFGNPSNNDIINLETVGGKTLLLTVEGVESSQIEVEPNTWLFVTISGDNGVYRFQIFDKCGLKNNDNATILGDTVTTDLFVNIHKSSLSGIWLGRRAVSRLSDEVFQFDAKNPSKEEAHFDISNVELHDSPLTAQEMSARCLPKNKT